MATSAQDASMHSSMKLPSGDCNTTASFTQDASVQDASAHDSMEHPPRKSPIKFLDLTGEIKNRIYKLLFSGTTIHLDGTAANHENKYRLCISTCTTQSADDYLATKNLAGASHAALKDAAGTSTIETYHTTDEVCDSNQIFLSNHICRQRVQLSTQLLRVYSEAGLLPYATNAFVFSGGLSFKFRAAFAQQFSEKQRRAIRTAILPAAYLGGLAGIPGVIPNVKHLWLEGPAPWREDSDEEDET